MNINKKDIGDCYRFLSHEKETEIRLIDPNRKNPPMSIFVNSKENFLKQCEKYNGKYNIYAGINERIQNGTEKKDVLSVKTIVLDIDGIRAKGFEKKSATEKELFECEKDCNNIIMSMVSNGCKYPTKLYSGNGYQIWIAIPKIDITNENRNEVESKLQKFQEMVKKRYEEFGGIDKIGDLPRIIKVWGTLNIKGDNTKERPFRVCKIDACGERDEDEKLKEDILNIDIKEEELNIKIESINNLEKEYLPKPFQYILYEYEHKKPGGWLRIVETLASFFRGIGLSKEKSAGYISDWSKKQPYTEEGESNDIVRIVNRIYKNNLFCPNFKKIMNESSGYPFFGLKDIFENTSFEDDFSIYKNPVVYYNKMKERKNNSNIQNLRLDIITLLLSKKTDEASELIVQEILKNNYIYTTKDDVKPEIWIYNGGIYIPQGKSEIEKQVRGLLGQSFTISLSNAILHKIKADTQIEMDEFFKSNYIDEVPVENGILNIFTRELTPFNPKKIFFNKLPITYDATATCPTILKFFEDVLKDKSDVPVMLELFGFAMLKEYRFEKAFMFVGHGRNGKSKTIELLKRMLGIDNCCSVPLSELTSDSTSVCELFGKMVNLAGDLSNHSLKKTGMFKQTVGRDLIAAKRKYLRDLPFINYAKHIFACNELPRVYDLTDGFWTKWVLLEFPYKFIPQKEFNSLSKEEQNNKKILDTDIIEKITTPQEMAGLLNLTLNHLNNLIDNKDFSYSIGTADIKDFWIRQSDSFTAFCMDKLVEDYNSKVSQKKLRKEYNSYCKKARLKGSSDKGIKVTLEDRYGAVITQDYEDKQRYWEGFRFKEQ